MQDRPYANVLAHNKTPQTLLQRLKEERTSGYNNAGSNMTSGVRISLDAAIDALQKQHDENYNRLKEQFKQASAQEKANMLIRQVKLWWK